MITLSQSCLRRTKKVFLEMESALRDAVNIIEMTTKDLECYINLVDKAAAGLRYLFPFWKGINKLNSNYAKKLVLMFLALVRI